MGLIETIPRRCAPFRCAAAMSEAPSRASSVTATWSSPPRGVVEGSEIVILAIKPSMWRPVFESAPLLVISILTAGVLLFLESPFPGLSLTLTCQFVLLIGVVRLALAVFRWIPTWYLLTNRRIITIHGVREPRIAAHPLLEVRNTYLQASPVEKWGNLGTITFVTDHARRTPQVWRSIARSQEVHTEVRHAIENAIDRHVL